MNLETVDTNKLNMIAVISEPHRVFLVQDEASGKVYVKKFLDVYNIDVYRRLYDRPVAGTPRIFACEEKFGKLILIEEYISGRTLRDMIDSGSISSDKIWEYTLKLCNTLEKLHEMHPPVIHRDIKPSNVIITSYDYPILIDFNAAKSFNGETASDTLLLGTPGYAAPEQFGFGSSSPRTDIYGMGMLLKEMVLSCAEHTDQFDEIIEKCTRMEPKERFQSAVQLRDAIIHLKDVSQARGEERVKPDLSVPQATETGDSVKLSEIVGIPETSRIGENQKTSGTDQSFKPLASDEISGTSRRRFLPPGFRTLSPWKMIIGVLGYLLILALSLTLEVKDVSGFQLWFERITCLLMMLSVVCVCTDYLGVQHLFVMCRHRNKLIHGIGVVVFAVIVVSMIFLGMILIEMIFLS